VTVFNDVASRLARIKLIHADHVASLRAIKRDAAKTTFVAKTGNARNSGIDERTTPAISQSRILASRPTSCSI